MIQDHVSLKPYNTFGIDAIAKKFASFHSVDELHEILGSATLPREQLLVLGGGSNLLFTQNFDGLVLKNNLEGIEKIGENEEHVFIKVGAGESWHQFVLFCIQHNYAGVENLSLIPGN
ncbi:MAG TPA: FAD-binding protein, partial [Chitinophagaceae bacterium]|nr:FAD-binding protein [Chitinophagaceae bacterium]